MALKTYSVYTQCARCGVYDRDPVWCDLCGQPKQIAGARASRGEMPRHNQAHAISRDARQNAGAQA